MKWDKRGLIFAPDGTYPWAQHSALQPTPFALDDDVIRVFVGLRDSTGVGSVGFVDVDARDPARIIRVCDEPALTRGARGAFDDNGVIPCAIVRREELLYLYYAGYQLGRSVRFYAFGGLAVSDADGESFERHSAAPVLDRSDEGLFFRVVHTVMPQDGIWRVWYGAGSHWVPGPAKDLPSYDIRYMESADGLEFGKVGSVCIPLERDEEYRVGRPFVILEEGVYRMFYAAATLSRGYRLGYAESPDGVTWVRKDDAIGLTVSDSGWDSQMVSFPSVIRTKDRVYLFYNGNRHGETGFGFAELKEW